METTNPTVIRGSGNVFADLEIPDADAHLLKTKLVTGIEAIVRQRGITQAQAARLSIGSHVEITARRAA